MPPQCWPLSQAANKSQGTCSSCFQTYQLHLHGNTIHLHGPRDARCPGSNRPPLAVLRSHSPRLTLNPSPRVSASQPLTSSHSSRHASPTVQAVRTPVISTNGSSGRPSTGGIVSQSVPVANRQAFFQTANSVTPKSFHQDITGPIVKHIPKSARPACCSELTSLINSIILRQP